jgi:hypothetical protein
MAYSILASKESIPNASAYLTCPSQKWIGLPCPGCGTTRSLLSILNGNFKLALNWNPFGFLALAFVAITPILLLIDFFAKQQTAWLIFNKTEIWLKNRFVLFSVLIIILLNWWWNWIKFA